MLIASRSGCYPFYLYHNNVGYKSQERQFLASIIRNMLVKRIATMQRRFQIYEPMTYDETVDLFYGLEAYNMKIAEFFPDVDFEAKGTFGKILKFFAEELTIRDIIHIAYGKYECLNKLRVPIQRFFEDNILCDGSDDDAIENIIGKITHEILEEIKPFTNNVKLLHEEVNFVGELFIFIENGIRDLLPILLNKSVPADVSYGDHLIAALQEISREFLIVNEKCSHNANMVLERMLREHCELVIRASRVNRPSHDALCSWILTTIRTFIRTFMPNLTSDGQIAASNNTSASKKKINIAKPNSSESARPRTNTRFLCNAKTKFRGGPRKQTSALLRNNTRSSDNHRNIAEVVLGSDSWHNSVPRDWVPIIARDVQRQRRQATQAPLSNAYLSGMPSKRRKIMTNGNPTLLEPSNSALSEMLLQAMSSANVKPIENIDELKKDILENSTLQTSFNKHMKNVIQDRLQCDLDYCSERFPNSEKYFK
ncbi:large proline-rich protein BAG6 [Caerostris extrusa]|uniref:Large proline-rich protein BAG6 n=1 Tax=Caerostris extrusa TaxID=172846 RepID=A0AAV4Y0L2_CAEEX|nr:large proline-rich protein BAG6 [Caerostris extrusa]